MRRSGATWIVAVVSFCSAGACSTILGIDGDYGDRPASTTPGPADDAASSCTDAPCAPPTVIAAGAQASALSADDTSIYWVEHGEGIDGGALFACAKPDCSGTTELAPFTQPVAVVLAGSDAFVLASKDLAGGIAPHVYRVPKTGGAPEDCSKNGAAGTATSIVSSGDVVYVARPMEIIACKPGCTGPAPCIRLLAANTTAIVAQAQDKLYWPATDGLRRCTINGDMCQADPMAIDPGVVPTEIVSMAADDGAIFVGGGGQIRAVARSTSDVRTVAALAPRPSVPLVEDATALYVATDSAIVRVDKSGGAPRTISDVSGATALAVDDTNVYFADPSRGIVRVPK